MKKTLSIILAALMLISVFSITALAADTSASKTGVWGDSGDLEWEFYENTGVLLFRGNGRMGSYQDETDRPWHSFASDIKSVALSPGTESIGTNAFYDCENLESISLSSMVDSVGEYAFAYTKISEFECPGVLDSIGKGAFYRCLNLTNVTLSSSIEVIDYDVFQDCPLESIKFTSSIKEIRSGAFRGCENLKAIDIPKGVTTIEEQAFAGCINVEEITVDLNNDNYYDGMGNAIIDKANDRLIVGCNNTVIPSTVKSIASFTFDGYTGLTSVDLPAGLTEIEDYTFRNTGLTSLDIPDGITQIGMGAFENCESIRYIIIPESVTYIDNYAFNNLQGLVNIYYTGTEEEYQELYKSENGKYMGMGNHYYLAPDMRNHYYNYDRNHEHEYNDWFVWRQATVNADGEMLRECIYCGIEDSKAIPQIKTVKLSKTSFEYTGKAIEPKVTIKDRTGKSLVKGTDYTLTYLKNKAIGKATARIAFTGKYSGVSRLDFQITKAKNPMTVKAVAKTVAYSKVSKAKQTVKGAIVVKKNKGKVTYSKAAKGSAKNLTVNSKGVITVKKGTKKGAYKIKVKVTAKGDKYYKAGSKTVTVKISVK